MHTYLFKDFLAHNNAQADLLKKITDPLSRHYGIDLFWHGVLDENGQFYNVCNWTEMFDYLWELAPWENTSYLINPHNLSPGCFYLDEDPEYEKLVVKLQNTYSTFHTLLFIRKVKSVAYFYGFASKKHNLFLPQFYMNNIPLLNKYIDYFIENYTHSQRLNPMHMINLKDLQGVKMFNNKNLGMYGISQSKKNNKFLIDIGTDQVLLSYAQRLTQREKEVLLGCSKGQSAKALAHELHLSPRTVHFYLNNAKVKLGIINRDELTAAIETLKISGFLENK